MHHRRFRGDGEIQAVGCIVWVVALAVIMVITAIVGGTWRTDVTFTPAVTVTGKVVPFQEEFTANHWLAGLMQGEQPDLKVRMAKYLQPNDQVGTITINTKHTMTNTLVSLVTLGIYLPVTVTVKGEIIRPEK
jgi:hypothetical protein